MSSSGFLQTDIRNDDVSNYIIENLYTHCSDAQYIGHMSYRLNAPGNLYLQKFVVYLDEMMNVM